MSRYADILGTLRSAWGLGPISTRLSLSWAGLTAPRAVSFPDKDGTIAMTSDITGGGVQLGGAASSATLIIALKGGTSASVGDAVIKGGTPASATP